MYKLKAEIRDMDIKAKRLRREGKVPAAIYGKDLETPINLEIKESDVMAFTSKLSKGSTLTIETNKDNYNVLFKEISMSPVGQNVEHIEFQSLIAGEEMNTVSQVTIHNKDKNKNIVQVLTEEIPYSANFKDFISEIIIDVNGLEAGTTIHLGDLDIAKNKNIKLALPEDTVIVTIEEPVVMTDEEIAELEAGEGAEVATEPEVIGEEDSEE